MPVFLFGSDNSVTRDTVALGGSPYADNDAALAAILAGDVEPAFADGDRVDWKEIGGVKFNTLSAFLDWTKDVDFRGVSTGGVRPIWDAPGAYFLQLNDPTKDCNFDGIDILNSNQPFFIRQAKDVTIKNTKFLADESKSLTLDFGGEFFAYTSAWFMGTGSSSILLEAITGNITMDNVDVDFETQADPNNPYAGIHADQDPDSWTPGGTPFLFGTANPSSWQSDAIDIFRVGGRLSITDCEIKNFAFGGITSINVVKSALILDNVLRTPYGAHSGGRPASVFSIITEVALVRSREVYGSYLVENNQLFLSANDALALVAISNENRALTTTFRKNTVIAAKGSKLLHFIQMRMAQFSTSTQNTLEGDCRRAIHCGKQEDLRTARPGASDSNYIAEDLSKTKSDDFEVWFTDDARRNTVVTPGMVNVRVLNEGLDNTVITA